MVTDMRKLNVDVKKHVGGIASIFALKGREQHIMTVHGMEDPQGILGLGDQWSERDSNM